MKTLVAGRYRIDRRVGIGGSASVWAAADTWHSGEAVALKVLSTSDRAYADLLTREFALLYGLRHPHIPRVLRLGRLSDRDSLEGAEAGAPFLVEELCEGEPADTWAHGRPTADIARVVAQIAAALAALHARDIHHGDVKPDNILVEGGDEPKARLIDFNLATRGITSVVSGTLRYMAPEALAGRRGPPSDVYALAATAVELITGAVPTGDHGCELTAPDIADAVESMSATDPGRRADAAAAFELLAAHADEAAREALGALRDDVTLGAGFCGRQDSVEKIDACLSAAVSGARVLRIVGPPGSGKTAVLRAAVARAAQTGWTVLGAVRPGRHGDVTEVERALAELRGAALEAHPAPAPDELTAEHWRRFSLLAEQLAQVGNDRPVAIVIDDVPAGAPLDDFAAFLERLGEQGPRVAWLQVTRGEAPAADITLGALDETAVRQMVRMSRPLRPLDVEAADALHAASGGNPQRIMALVASHPGDSLLRAAQRGELAASDSLRDTLEAHVNSLPEATRTLAAVVALLEPPVPLALLTGINAVVDAVAPAVVNDACNRGVLVRRAWEGDTALTVAGEALREVLSATANDSIVRGVVLAAEASGGASERAAEVGRLWLRLGETRRAVAPLLSGARHAESALRLRDSVLLYDALIGMRSLDTATRSRALVESAEVLVALGQRDAAIERFRRASTDAEARIGLAEALIGAGRHELASSAALTALQRQTPHPREAELRGVQGLVAYYAGNLDSAQRLLTQAAELAATRGAARLVDSTRANLAMVLHKAGDLVGAESAYAESLAAARAQRDLPRQLLRLSNLATLRQEQGRFEDALAGYQEAAGLARLVDGERELVRVALNWANLAWWLGDAEAAKTRAEEALAVSDRVGMRTEGGYLRLVLAEAFVALGDNGAATRSAEAAHELFVATQDKAGLAETDAVRAELAMHRRDAATARRCADTAAALAHEVGRDRIEAQALVWRALADLDEPSGAPEAAATAATRAAGLADGRNDPDIGWLAHAAASRLHARTGRQQEARFHLGKARELAGISRARLSARHERSYAALWFRRELWALVSQPEGTAAAQPGRDLDRLLAINRELAQDHDPDRLLDRIIDAAIALSGAERGFIVLRETNEGDGEETLSVRAARNIDQESLATDAVDLSKSIATEAMAAGVPVTSINALDDERFRSFMSVHDLKLRSVLCLPLTSQAGVLGALYLDNRYRVNAFSEADVALLSAFGHQGAIALANARMMRELEQRSSDLERSRAEIEELNQRLEKELHASSEALAAVRGRIDDGADGETGRHGMVGRSASMREVYRVIERVADKDVPVTILGESGTGKELVARAIHGASQRADGPFVSVNCGAIPHELLESELFGHERGAFTGAVRGKPGLFEVAGGGTIFLDEIGDMPLGMQVKLLRVLQQHEFRRVGGTTILHTDARVLSASNRDLETLVRDGRFREDLWYRLNVVELHLPALRQRREDLPLLIDHMLSVHGGASPPTLSRAALAALLDHPWPGNVRELENEIQRAVALAEGEILADALSSKVSPRGMAGAPAGPGERNLKDAVETYEAQLIRETLAAHDGRVAAAAKALGLTRAGLYKKINKYGLSDDKSRQSVNNS